MPNFISMSEGRKKIINLRAGIKNPLLARLFGLVEKPVESFFGLRRLDEAYRRLHAMDDGRNFFERAIDILGVKFEADPEDIAKIPTAGPLVVVSNHPLGCVDGIILGAVLTRVRKDAKMILNSMLSPMDEINECSISVNPFGGKKAAAQNVSAMKERFFRFGCPGGEASFSSAKLFRRSFRPVRRPLCDKICRKGGRQ